MICCTFKWKLQYKTHDFLIVGQINLGKKDIKEESDVKIWAYGPSEYFE